MSSMLSPYRILDLTDERANLTGLLLAQLGAEVIAVEPPDGTHSRQVAPSTMNRNPNRRSPIGRGTAERSRWSEGNLRSNVSQ